MRKAALLIMALLCVSLISFSQDNQLKPGTTIISPSGVKTMDKSGQVRQSGLTTKVVTQRPVFQDGVNIDIAPYIIETPHLIRPNSNQVDFTIDGQRVLIEKQLFMDIYENNVRLNKNRFNDVNKIQVGDTILLAPRTLNGGNQIWIANEKAPEEMNECLWLISAKYILGDLQTQPASIQFTVDPEQGNWYNSMSSLERIFFWALVVCILLLIAGAIVWLFIRQHDKALRKQAEIQKYEQEKAKSEIAAAALLAKEMEEAERQKYPENHPPVITGGLSKDDNTALQQICQAYKIDPTGVKALERVTFIRHGGPLKVELKMLVGATSQPSEKDLYIFPGEPACKIIYEESLNKENEYYKNHCGNRFGSIVANGKFTAPPEWEEILLSKFVPAPANTTEASTATSNGSSNGNGNANGKAKDTMSITIEVNGKEAVVSHIE